jgi:hypothetical protein
MVETQDRAAERTMKSRRNNQIQPETTPSNASLSPSMPLDRQSSSITATAEGDVGLMSEGPLRNSKRRHRPGFNMFIDDEDDVLVTSSSPPAPTFSPTTSLIDNSVLVYIPMHLRCGVTVLCRPDVLARCPSVLRTINRDVQGCLDILPRSVHALIRRTKIWVNTTFYYGPHDKPRNVNHSTAHHHEGWLLW